MKHSILMLINVLIFASPSFASNSEKVLEEAVGGVGIATQCKAIPSQDDLAQGHSQRSKENYPKVPLIEPYSNDFIKQNYLPHLEGFMVSQSNPYYIVKQGNQGSMIVEAHYRLNESEMDPFVGALNNAETLSDLINGLKTSEELRDSNLMRTLEKSPLLSKK